MEVRFSPYKIDSQQIHQLLLNKKIKRYIYIYIYIYVCQTINYLEKG
jgi:hypothetical protein